MSFKAPSRPPRPACTARGGHGNEGDKLTVSDSGTIEFYISNVRANETTTFVSGVVTEFALTFPTVEGPVDIQLVTGST